jgi:hypothetical protein
MEYVNLTISNVGKVYLNRIRLGSKTNKKYYIWVLTVATDDTLLRESRISLESIQIFRDNNKRYDKRYEMQ